MAKIHGLRYVVSVSIMFNMLLLSVILHRQWELSWSREAAVEAERVAAISCSGHGHAYLDGLLVEGRPVCECHSCYSGPDCSEFLPGCPADVDSGDPLFLEPFWMQNAKDSAVVVSGWHRMSYTFNGDVISEEIVRHIRMLHATVGNAVTEGRFILFGVGSTQLLNAAVHALSIKNASSPTKVVASIPFYPVYQLQTDFFRSVDFEFQGDTSLWKNKTDSSTNFIEFVNSPNNPDGQLKKAVLKGPNVNTIYDYAYYWPHFTAIQAPADEDIMIFTLSKITGHAGSRLGWALIRDESIYQIMSKYIKMNILIVPHETQLRALKLLKVILKRGGRDIFEFGYQTMRNRWEKLSKSFAVSKYLSIQELPQHYCNYFQKIQGPSPAYAWLKCEREEDQDCTAVLKASGIIGRTGSRFYAGERYVRLSLIKNQDNFDLLLRRIDALISEEDGEKIYI